MIANSRYDTSVDDFSNGIVMIHMFSGRWPEPQWVGPSRIQGDRLTEAERHEVFLRSIGDELSSDGLLLFWMCTSCNICHLVLIIPILWYASSSKDGLHVLHRIFVYLPLSMYIGDSSCRNLTSYFSRMHMTHARVHLKILSCNLQAHTPLFWTLAARMGARVSIFIWGVLTCM